jgi:glycerophosphoryl diester phosphodiesterase
MIIIGHRGARGLALENTLESFDVAIAHGVSYVEFDVRLTRDNQLVVMHDRHTKRVAYLKQHIRSLTLEEVKGIAMKDGGTIPTLDEAIAHIGQRVKINIELKSRGGTPYLLRTIRQMLKNGYRYDDFFVSSFRVTELAKLRRSDKHLALAVLRHNSPLSFIPVARLLHLQGVGLKDRTVEHFTVRMAKKMNLFTYVYTVNDPTRAAQLSHWGVDAICTDRPDLFEDARWLQEQRQKTTLRRSLSSLKPGRH